MDSERGSAGLRVQAVRGPQVSQRRSLHRGGREVQLPTVQGRQDPKEKVREVEVVGPYRVRFHLHEPYPDFMAFYGTLATGAEVGLEGFMKQPIGLGPYKFVSHTPGIELIYGGFRGLLAQGALREAAGLQECSGGHDAGGDAEAR